MTQGRPPADPARWSRVRAIFEAALDASASQRPALLDRLCADDAALRDEVLALLAADEAMASDGSHAAFLETPPDAAWLLAAAGGPDDGAGTAPDERIGQVLGGYRIIRVLGEGGMGTVYEAEQQLPRRRVALKVVRWTGRTDEARLRLFQRESEALARLRHPGIAAIYEAGIAPDGQHFFAMELVRGRSLGALLHDWRDRGPLDRTAIRERVSLFIEICDALSYAHQSGVIHRDLKPSNILVVDRPGESTSSGLQPRTRLLDFGLARLTGIEGAESITLTTEHSIQGTLAYMSPEQARGNPDEIDYRSDIYTLGVLLYEMLTGRLPYDLKQRPLMEALRIVSEEAPRRPATLQRALAGDLETVLLKALEKQPERRYQSVAGLSDDLQRHLDDLPIEARPATLAYQVQKLARRHRVATLLGVGLVLAVLVGAAGTTIGMVRARKAAALARQEAATAAEVSRFLETLFRVSNPSEARGNSITARELLDAGAARIDTSLVDQPVVRARLMAVMGDVYRTMGLYKESRPLLERALELNRATLEPDDPALASSEFTLGTLLRRLGEYDAAREHYQRSLDIRERIYGPIHSDVAASLTGLANVSLQKGDYAAAQPLYERCLAIVEKTKGHDHPDLAIYLSNLALAHRTLGDYAGSLPLVTRAITIEEKALGSDHPSLAYDLGMLGGTLNGLGRFADALVPLRRALAIQEKTLGPEHPDVAETLGTLGLTVSNTGDLAGARPILERSWSIFRKNFGDENMFTAAAADNLAAVIRGLGDVPQALALSSAALKTIERLGGVDHPGVVTTLAHLAEHHVAAGRPETAKPLLDRALRVSRAAFGPDAFETLEVLRYMAPLYAQSGDPERARQIYHAVGLLMDPMPAWPDTSWIRFYGDGAALWREAGHADSADFLERRRAELQQRLMPG
jgi:tetratricopeptide (TPR) repeat protein/tRNA A-37 threonylcarbamoyl transferase component Bud32